jgi:EAL domain-containing protein (putative c-di-GMP-specific phosphodiesterase class I)
VHSTTVIAEGVETAAELDALKSLGVDAAQGYLLGRPTTSPADWFGWAADAAMDVTLAGPDAMG